ncbi:MAG: DUF1566 domain-containing protein [Nitrospinaceae bacterium]
MTEEEKQPPAEETPENPEALQTSAPESQEIEKVDEGPKRFVALGPHVINDTETGIYWMKKDSWLDKSKFFNWHEGKDYAVTKNIRRIGGFDDWRMPTLDEAATLFGPDFENHGKGGQLIHIDKAFPEGSFKMQWATADTSTKRPRLDYTTGQILHADEYSFGSVRLCRREQIKQYDRHPRPQRRR